MQCGKCNYPDSRVVETTKDERRGQIMRRRECIKCGVRFTTQEDIRQGGKGANYQTPSPKKVLDK